MNISEQLAVAQKKKSRQTRILLLGSFILLMGHIIIFWGLRGMDVIISPGQASEQSQISVTSGLGWVIENKVYALFSRIEITVTAPGFYSEQRKIPYESKSNYLEILMQEKPGALML